MSRAADDKTPTRSLPDWLAYLESIGAKPCSCRYAWKSLAYKDGGRLIHPGYGWVRMNTDPRCQEHGRALTGDPSCYRSAIGIQVHGPGCPHDA